jgi:hypothetical protein
MTCSTIMVVRFFIAVRVIRHQAEGVQVGCDSFHDTDHPRPVESNKLRLDIFIGPKIHNQVFATLQSLQPAVQRRNTSTSLAKRTWITVSDSVPFGFFLSTGTSARLSQLAHQTGISLPSGALSSWWIRLELSPVAPAILRMDRPTRWAETIAQIRST